MKGIDMINAFGGIDEDLILDAENHKKAIPLWLKYTSLAACLLCAVTLFGLSLGRIFAEPETPGEAFAEPSPSPAVSQLPAEDSAEETPIPTAASAAVKLPDPLNTTRTASPIEDSLYWESSRYGKRIHAPSKYEGELYPDMDFSHEDYFITYYGTVFTFVDTTARTEALDYTGLVWCITATRLDIPGDWTEQMNHDNFYMYNDLLLGSDDTYMYELVYPNPSYQCDYSDAAALESYYQHLTDGLNMLNDFIITNDLTEYENWVDDYKAKTFKSVENAMKALRGEAVSPEEQVWAVRSLKMAGFSLNMPADMYDSIVTDIDTISFSLYEPISKERLGGNGGLVWRIEAYDPNGFCRTFGRENTDFTGDALDASSYMLCKDDGYIFVVSFPTDTQYDPSSPESTAAYRRYKSDSVRILTDAAPVNQKELNPHLDLTALLS